MKNNFVRLQTIVGEQLGIEPSQINPDSEFTKELGADSLDVVELIMVIEDEFEIEIDDKVASKIGTVQDALNYIEGSWDKI
jgi:acyl carrier protein